jgi:hypothetical protein
MPMTRIRYLLLTLCVCALGLKDVSAGDVIQCTHGCQDIRIGRLFCVSCCTCCIVNGVHDCECNTSCVEE